MMYVYILLCSDNSYYTGVTNDYEGRFSEHREGLNPKSYTYNRRPVELVYIESYDQPIKAINREKQIKGWSRAKKGSLIDGNLNELVRLSNNHPSTGSG